MKKRSKKVPVRDSWEMRYGSPTYSGGAPPSRTTMMQGVDTGRAKLVVDGDEWRKRQKAGREYARRARAASGPLPLRRARVRRQR